MDATPSRRASQEEAPVDDESQDCDAVSNHLRLSPGTSSQDPDSEPGSDVFGKVSISGMLAADEVIITEDSIRLSYVYRNRWPQEVSQVWRGDEAAIEALLDLPMDRLRLPINTLLDILKVDTQLALEQLKDLEVTCANLVPINMRMATFSGLAPNLKKLVFIYGGDDARVHSGCRYVIEMLLEGKDAPRPDIIFRMPSSLLASLHSGPDRDKLYDVLGSCTLTLEDIEGRD